MAVVDYTKNIVGIDQYNHFISNYHFLRSTKEWLLEYFYKTQLKTNES